MTLVIYPLLYWDCKGTNYFETCKLFFNFFFRREKFPLKKHQIDCSAGYAAVSKVENCTEECARIIHPWKPVIKKREIEHVNDLSEHEWERSSRHYCLGPYEAVEETIDDVSHRTGSDHGQSDENAGRRGRFLCQFADPHTECTEKHDAEDREENLAPVTAEGHTERHALVEHEMQLEPVAEYVDGLTQVHIRLDQNFNDLVKHD